MDHRSFYPSPVNPGGCHSISTASELCITTPPINIKQQAIPFLNMGP